MQQNLDLSKRSHEGKILTPRSLDSFQGPLTSVEKEKLQVGLRMLQAANGAKVVGSLDEDLVNIGGKTNEIKLPPITE